MTSPPELVLPSRIVGPSLTAAGLAAWVLAHAGREQDAERTGALQEAVDAALGRGATDVRVPRALVVEAADLWDRAAALADARAGSASGKDAAEWQRHAERLRTRSRSLRDLAAQPGGSTSR